MKRKGDLRELFRNKVRLLHQTRRRITKLEKEIVANGEELSEEFDSGSSLGHGSDTSSSDEAPGAPLMHSPSDEPGSASTAPPAKALPAPPRPKAKATPAVKKTAEKSGKEGEDGKPKGRGVREYRPFIPPGEPAPNHRGKQDIHGQLCPGFVETDPRYCSACEQLRRGFNSATKPHRPKVGVCAWAPLAGKQ